MIYELICQKPPFEASSMDELFKAVVKGKFEPVPLSYSAGLERVISSLIKVSPSKRPNCRLIINDSTVKKWSGKILDPTRNRSKAFSKTPSGYNTNVLSQSNSLIKTIKNFKNMKTLATKLPESQYQDQVYEPKVNEIRRENSDVYSSMVKNNTSLNESSRDSLKKVSLFHLIPHTTPKIINYLTKIAPFKKSHTQNSL